MKIKLIKIVCSLILLGTSVNARADWTFVVLGDTRDNDTTSTGISPHLNAIAQKIAGLNPSFVVVVGDLCNGDCLNSSTTWDPTVLYPGDGVFTSSTAQAIYETMFNNWKTAMRPVFDYSNNTGIHIYTVRGNHENNDQEQAPIPVLKQAYQNAFSSYVPNNGPIDSLGNQQGLSWSLTQNNVTIVAADQYFGYSTPPAGVVSGYHTLDQAWVIQQFQQSTSPYKIFMAHEPIFPTEGNAPGAMEDDVAAQKFFGADATGTQTRTAFWSNIGSAGVRLYLTGHLHLLTAATIPDGNGNQIVQLTAGNGGAPPQPYVPVTGGDAVGVNLNFTNGNSLTKVTFGFSLVTVRDAAMTIQYYSLDTTTGSWSVAPYSTQILPVQNPTPTPPIPEPSCMILIAVGVAGVVFFTRRRTGAA